MAPKAVGSIPIIRPRFNTSAYLARGRFLFDDFLEDIANKEGDDGRCKPKAE